MHIYDKHFSEFFLKLEIFQITVVERIKIHNICSLTFFRKSSHLWDNVEKYGETIQATDNNDTAHELCTLDN